MKLHHGLLALSIFGTTVACGAIVGIRDVSDAPAGGDASTTPDGASEAASPDAAVDAAKDAGPDAPVSEELTGGEAHFLQAGDTVTLAYVEKATGATKDLEVSANGAFTFPAVAKTASVKTPAANKRCWLRDTGKKTVDVRCVLAAQVVVPAATTESGSYVAIPGGEATFSTDLAKSTLLVTFSMPFASTSAPEVNPPNLASVMVRAIVDGDPDKTIELTRGSTYWHQGWNQMLLGTIEVGPGPHTVATEFREIQPTPVAGRAAQVGAQIDLGRGVVFDYKSELLVVGLESLRTFEGLESTKVTAEQVLTSADKNKWHTMHTVSGTSATPQKALVTAYYPEVEAQSASSVSAAWYALMAGTQTLAGHDLYHVQDSNGVRPITLVSTATVSGPWSFQLDQRTAVGPTRIAPGIGGKARAGGAISALLFSPASDLQSWSFSGDADLGGAVNAWQPVAGSKATVKTKGKALLFANVNRLANTTPAGASEIGVFDGATELVRGWTQSWSYDYGQGCAVATMVDFSGAGPHEVELRVRRGNDGVPLLRHSPTPDFRGVSSITVVPLD
ncbi:MAG: hypothetical protein JNL38_33575 [Myxococcales bacterium]|jgi:hypothetical protein|nr:hypothetical protein [Myxococcales bacterium]